MLGAEEGEEVVLLVVAGDVGEFGEVAPFKLPVDVGELEFVPPLMLLDDEESIGDGDVIVPDPCVESEVEDCDDAGPAKAESVCESRPLELDRPCADWNERSAFCVFGPMTPSTGPGSKPFSFSACCAWRTADESVLLGVLVVEDVGEAFGSACVVDRFWLPAANAVPAVIRATARASFLDSM